MRRVCQVIRKVFPSDNIIMLVHVYGADLVYCRKLLAFSRVHCHQVTDQDRMIEEIVYIWTNPHISCQQFRTCLLWFYYTIEETRPSCYLNSNLKIFFSHTYRPNSPIILKFCTEHGSVTAMLCAKFQNDLTIGINVVLFFRLCLRWILFRYSVLWWHFVKQEQSTIYFISFYITKTFSFAFISLSWELSW